MSAELHTFIITNEALERLNWKEMHDAIPDPFVEVGPSISVSLPDRLVIKTLVAIDPKKFKAMQANGGSKC